MHVKADRIRHGEEERGAPFDRCKNWDTSRETEENSPVSGHFKRAPYVIVKDPRQGIQ